MDALVPLSATRGGPEESCSSDPVSGFVTSRRSVSPTRSPITAHRPAHRTARSPARHRTQDPRTGPAHSASLRSSARQQVSVAGLRLHVQVVRARGARGCSGDQVQIDHQPVSRSVDRSAV